MQEKCKRVVIDRWSSFNDVAGGARFINGVSEPVTEFEAHRLAVALSGRVVEADEYSPDEWEGVAPGPEDGAIAEREVASTDVPGSAGNTSEGSPEGDGASDPHEARSQVAGRGRRKARG